jgi:hypothetical protein
MTRPVLLVLIDPELHGQFYVVLRKKRQFRQHCKSASRSIWNSCQLGLWRFLARIF